MGEELVGVLMLGAKQGDIPYNQADVAQLQQIAERFSPLLVQTQTLAQNRKMYDVLLQEKRELALDNQQLRALNQLVGRFLEQITPDLKRPFRSMRAEIAQNPQPTLATQHQQLEDMMDGLIKTAARLRNREKFQFEAVRIDEIARTAQRRLAAMAEARQVRVEFAPHGKMAPILGDADQLTEAVQVMLHNAIKFNRVGGVVTIGYGAEEKEAYLRIHDQGVGMTEFLLQELWAEFPIFDPEENAGNSRRPGRLGLTLAQFIAQAHGGRIEVESKYGTGSVFSLYLPLAQ
jgi:signal transduction histidine kinase